MLLLARFLASALARSDASQRTTPLGMGGRFASWTGRQCI